MKERTAKREALEWAAAAATAVVVLALLYAGMIGLAAVRGGSNPHSDDPCAPTYEGPPAACIPHDPSGTP